MLVVADCETNALESPTRLWVIVCKEVPSGEVHVFREPDLNPRPFIDFADGVSGWIGHNFLIFDRIHINRLVYQQTEGIKSDRVVDTLIVSRLLDFNRSGGHSLESWGNRLGSLKGDFSEWDRLSEEMVSYCIQDVNVTYKLFKHFEKYIFSERWKEALRTEHDMAIICSEMTQNGFSFDIEKCKELYEKVSNERQSLETELQSAFPPRSRLIREITPRGTAHGTIHRGDFRWNTDRDLSAYSIGCPFSLISWEPFNPGSPKQIVQRLNEAGWQPTEKTKGYLSALRNKEYDKIENYEEFGWKVSEENLKTLPDTAPEPAKKLARYLLVKNRESVLTEWLSATRPDGRIHGTVHPIGAWTGRCSHSDPNTGNIPRDDAEFGTEMRSMWRAADGHFLVGVDAESIQLRVLAHYINDESFTHAVIAGRKEDKTDPHSLNQRALGDCCKSRNDAKTFIYAWLLGAGGFKVSQILGCTLNEAVSACKRFVEYYPGLAYVKRELIPRDAARGYFEGFDGRYVICPFEDPSAREHFMLAGYLQNGETIVMKRANIIWREELIKKKIPFKQVNFVHDEWQTEVPTYDIGLEVANIQAESIRLVGERYELKCPMAGSILSGHGKIAIGSNWSLTH